MTLGYLKTLCRTAAWYRNKDYIRLGVIAMQAFPYEASIAAQNLLIPWAVDMSDDGRLYFTERIGNLRVIENGVLNPAPVHTFKPPFINTGEGGLLGLALDRDFISNGFIYLMYTYQDGNELFSRVVRMHITDNSADDEMILLDRIPASQSHNGGRIKIGPDGYLYITTGDAGNRYLAQDVNSLAGKILRIQIDGGIPSDNPFPGSPVYSIGLRNPQGLAWNSQNVLYATDHGESAHDEINIIIPGGNYGWPVAVGDEGSAVYIRPLIQSGLETWAPSGMAYITEGPWAGRLIVSALKGAELLTFTLNEEGTEVTAMERFLQGRYGRLREAYQAKDGSIYITTSNLDGRGLQSPGDDKIIHLVPRMQGARAFL